MSKTLAPPQFRNVRGATPDEIGMTLAEYAAAVPTEQAIVELGVFQARTLLLMAWGAENGLGAHVWGVDAWDLPGNTYAPPFTDAATRQAAHANVDSLGYAEGVTLVNAFSHSTGTFWAGPPVGLLFIDGDHSKEGATRDVVSWAPQMAPGGIIAADDYDHPDWPGVAEALHELVAQGFLEPLEIVHSRLAVTRLAGD